MKPARARRIALLLMILVALAFRFWRLGAMPLFSDEAYYLLWADRLAPAYVDHPAGIAALLKTSTALLGRSEFGVRWLNALLSTACVPLAYAVGRRYISAAGGFVAATVVAFGPLYLITGRVAYPDTLQMVLILANLLCLAPLLGGQATLLRWALFGFTLALLFNTKLSSAFYAVGLGIYLLGWRRDLLRQPGLWLAVGLAALGLLPVIGWNAAHDWAGLRWAIAQGGGLGLPRPGLGASLAHAGRYLTPPVALVAGLAAATAVLGLAARRAGVSQAPPASGDARPLAALLLLPLLAACLLLPILLSKANSPRNLGVGLLVLWPLAGAAIATPARTPGGATRRARLARRSARILRLLVLPLCLWLILYGVGTTAALLGPTRLPASSGTGRIRADAAGWREFAAEVRWPAERSVFAVDYSIAGQAAHYLGRPVYSAHPQFRLWGLPDLEDLTVLSQDFVPPELISERLQADFARIAGPDAWRHEAAGISKTVYIWQASARRAPMAQLLEDLDFLRLAQAAAVR